MEVHLFSLIYLIVQFLFILVCAHEYSFYTLGYNTIIHYFLVQIVTALALRSCFNWLLYSFVLCTHAKPHHCGVSSFVRCSQIILDISCPSSRSTISSR